MSTLSVSNITDGTDTVETGYVVNGSAKAWCKYNMVSSTVVGNSHNISSLTDNGTGDTTHNFSNVFSSAEYAFTACSSNAGSTDGRHIFNSTTPPAATGCRIITVNSTQAVQDGNYVGTTFHGDLA